MSKIKSFFKRNGKKFSIVVASAFMVVVSCVSSFAAEAGAATSSTDLQSSFSTAISSIQSDVLGYIVLALPVGLAIFGTVIAVKKGISFVRGLIGR